MGWPPAKLVLALILAGLHGPITWQARAIAAKSDCTVPGFAASLPWVVLCWACVAGIAVLAVVKPGR